MEELLGCLGEILLEPVFRLLKWPFRRVGRWMRRDG